MQGSSEQQTFIYPTAEPIPPTRGRTRRSRAASESGAGVAVDRFGQNSRRILKLLRVRPMCRQDVAALTKIPINSICSLWKYLHDTGRIVSNGDFDEKAWPCGKVSKRERFRVAP